MWSDVDLNCNLTRESCTIPQEELAERDIIAILRSILSLLSIIGTFSIIVSVIRGRQTCSPKIHPIFMLSIADFILGALWMAGGGIWLSDDPYHFKSRFSRKNCFVILLATVILECVTVNLTCVYALLAYSSIKQRDFSNVYSLLEKDANSHVWKPWKTILVYVASWVLPVIFILVPFAAVDSKYGMVHNTDRCTCWCVPYFGNLKPHTEPVNMPSAQYMYGVGVFVVVYSVVVAVHYIVGFLLLSFVYMAILNRIRRMRTTHKKMTKNSNLFGATEAILMKGQSQAKTRVVVFLTVFIICSFFNLFLAIILLRHSSLAVERYNTESKLPGIHRHHVIPIHVIVAYISQSITVPLQGFLNAIVYGWTRKDFVQAMDIRAKNQVPPVVAQKGLFFKRNQQEQQQQQDQDRQYVFSAKDTSRLLSNPNVEREQPQVFSPTRKTSRLTLSESSGSDTSVDK